MNSKRNQIEVDEVLDSIPHYMIIDYILKYYFEELMQRIDKDDIEEYFINYELK